MPRTFKRASLRVLPACSAYSTVRATVKAAIVLILTADSCFALARYITGPTSSLTARSASSRAATFPYGQPRSAKGKTRLPISPTRSTIWHPVSIACRSHKTLLRDISHELRSPLPDCMSRWIEHEGDAPRKRNITGSDRTGSRQAEESDRSRYYL